MDALQYKQITIERLNLSVRSYNALKRAEINTLYVTLKEERTRLRDDAPSIRRERKDYIERRRSAISEIRDKKSKRRDVGSELRSMRDSHSNDL